MSAYLNRKGYTQAQINKAIYELKNNGRENARKIIIFLTDGIVDTGDKTKDIEREKWLKDDLARDSQKAEILIFGIAFTENADFSLIQTLSSKTGGEYYRVLKVEDIETSFNEIFNVITKYSKKQTAAAQTTAVTPSPGVSAPVQPQPPEEKNNLILLLAGIIVFGCIFLIGVIFIMKSGLLGGRASEPVSPQEESTPIPDAELIDTDSIISESSILIKKLRTKIGRGVDNDIVFPDMAKHVSSHHALFEYRDDSFWLKDLESSNGTKVNNSLIPPNKPVQLENGDEIMFDVFKFRFIISGQPILPKTYVRSPDSKSTILRQPIQEQKKPLENADVSENKDIDQALSESSPKEPVKQQQKPSEARNADQNNRTKLKPGMCPNHPAKKATEMCHMCHKVFCKQCMSETHPNHCKECAINLT